MSPAHTLLTYPEGTVIDEKKQNGQDAHEKQYRAAKPWELIISSVAGVVSGLIAAAASIRREFNSEVTHWPGGDALTKEYQKLFNDLDNNFYGKPDQWRDHAIQKGELKSAYDKKFTRDFLYQKHGIQTEGAIEGASIWQNIKMSVYGTYQRHEHLGKSNKRLDVWYKAIAVASIIGVGAYNLLTSIATRQKTRQIEDLILDRVLETPEVKEHREVVEDETKTHPNNRVHEAASTERVTQPPHHKTISA